MGKRLNYFENRDIHLFNTSIEYGVRSLFIINKIFPQSIDLSRLAIYDFLILHSGDVKNGPESIQPAIPHRGIEYYVKVKQLKKGLFLMSSKNLLKISINKEGVKYIANELTEPFLSYFQSDYSKLLKERIDWVVGYFGDYDDTKLSLYLENNIDKWGGEFTKESLFRGFDE
jgi:hypothetical protein